MNVPFPFSVYNYLIPFLTILFPFSTLVSRSLTFLLSYPRQPYEFFLDILIPFSLLSSASLLALDTYVQQTVRSSERTVMRPDRNGRPLQMEAVNMFPEYGNPSFPYFYGALTLDCRCHLTSSPYISRRSRASNSSRRKFPRNRRRLRCLHI